VSYIFPRRRLRSADILDPEELNGDFIPAAELCSGKLNAHNVSRTVDVTPDSAALFDYVYEKGVANPGMGTPGAFKEPSHENSTNEVAIPNTFAWTAMETATITTGISKLWILGFAQYFWTWWDDELGSGWDGSGIADSSFNMEGNYPNHGFGGWTSAKEVVFDGGTQVVLNSSTYDPWGELATKYDAHNPSKGYAASGYPCGVQFAIRVDGQVLEWTITGKHNPFETTVVPYQPADVLSAAAFPPNYVKRTGTCGPEMFPVRMGSVFPVQAGEHTIEVVARRIPRSAASFSDAADHVYTFNRQLFVMDMPTFPSATASVATVQPDALESEDVVSAKSIGTDGIDAVRDALNDVQPGYCGRGAFTRDHFASPVAFSTQETFSTTTTAYNHYPGFSSDDVASTTTDESGWYLIQSVNTASSLGWNTTDSTVVVVLANISVTKMMLTTTANPYSVDIGNFYRDVVASFQLGYYRNDTGAWVMMKRSQGSVNHQLWWSMNKEKYGSSAITDGKIVDPGWLEGSDNEPDRFDVALMVIIDDSTEAADAIANITSIGLFGSVLQMGNGSAQEDNEISYTYDKGSVQVFQLKK